MPTGQPKALDTSFDALIEIGGVYVDDKSNPWGGYGHLRALHGKGHVLFQGSVLSYPGICAHLMNDAVNCFGVAPNGSCTYGSSTQ